MPVLAFGFGKRNRQLEAGGELLPWLAAIKRGLPEPMDPDPSATAACT
jgi:hypothetical protein